MRPFSWGRGYIPSASGQRFHSLLHCELAPSAAEVVDLAPNAVDTFSAIVWKWPDFIL